MVKDVCVSEIYVRVDFTIVALTPPRYQCIEGMEV